MVTIRDEGDRWKVVARMVAVADRLAGHYLSTGN
jgi:hypothetical protein